MRMLKKMLSVVLVVCLCVLALPMSVSAAEHLVSNASDLDTAITNFNSSTNDVIKLTGDIQLNGPLALQGKDIIIDGDNQYTITGTTGQGYAISIEGSNNISPGSITLQKMTFENHTNRAITITGGVTNFTLVSCHFKNNTGGNTVNGGAIYISSSPTVVIDDCTFTDNYVTGDGYYGGAIGITTSSSDVTVKNSTFEGNTTGAWGGAICFHQASSGNYTITNCIFNGNATSAKSASSGAQYDGGAINFYGINGTINIDISESIFIGNTAHDGGAIGIVNNSFNSTINIKNCIMYKNTATLYGGAMYIYQPSVATIENNIIIGNKYQGLETNVAPYATITTNSSNMFVENGTHGVDYTAKRGIDFSEQGNYYAVIYDANGGQWPTISADYSTLPNSSFKYVFPIGYNDRIAVVSDSSPIDLSMKPQEPNATGGYFVGWSTDPTDSTVTTYSNSDTYNFTGGDHAVTLYAVWSDAGNITLDYNDGRTETINSEPNKLIQGLPESPSRPGYRFIGWFESDGTEWTNGNNVVPAAGTPLTLTAKWEPYKVTFDNDGSTSAGTVLADGLIQKPSDPSRFGHTFMGWVTAEKYFWDFGKDIPTDDLILYAAWKDGVGNIYAMMNGQYVLIYKNEIDNSTSGQGYTTYEDYLKGLGGSDSSDSSGSGTSGSAAGDTTGTVIGEDGLILYGLPEKIYVGTRFTLTANIDGQSGSDGWKWDETYFDATFNSPATFTALKVGTTTITFTNSEGKSATANVEILPAGAQQTNPSTGGSGGPLHYLVPIYAVLSAIIALIVTRRKKDESFW